jgi:predicted N-acetyltransferase YhbS
MKFEYLADHLELASILADWHFAEWRALLPNWTREEAERDLRSHVNRLAIPTTFVSFEDNRLIGSASLLSSDLEGLERYSPWLASVFVIPEFRNRGIGKALVGRVLEEAKQLGFSLVYLWTSGQAEYYRKMGWEDCERTQHHGNNLLVMRHSTH